MNVCSINEKSLYSKEFALCDGYHALSIHKKIFHLPDDNYFICTEGQSFLSKIDQLVSSLFGSKDIPIKVHIVIDWETLFRLLLWKDEHITVKQAYMLLIDAGLTRIDIEPFLNSSLMDLFPSIYYSKRLEVLRRLCSKVKKTVEAKFSTYGLKTDCHLVPKGIDLITASSL
ncbi:MAG TPA: hypothetical protein HPP56_03625 [Nitrospirae bacterium]|nr:hypothetical protein [Nitrospirota bacterium]